MFCCSEGKWTRTVAFHVLGLLGHGSVQCTCSAVLLLSLQEHRLNGHGSHPRSKVTRLRLVNPQPFHPRSAQTTIWEVGVMELAGQATLQAVHLHKISC